MFEHIYISEIKHLVLELNRKLDIFQEWKENNFSKELVLASNVDNHNTFIQEIITQAAQLADLLQGDKSSKDKQLAKKRKDFLTQIGIIDNSKLRTLLKRDLRDTIIHFSEKIDALNFGEEIKTPSLLRLYNISISGEFIETNPQTDKRFKLYTCSIFKNDNVDDGIVLPIKVYNSHDNCYYNLYAKISISDLRSDIQYMEKILRGIKSD